MRRRDGGVVNTCMLLTPMLASRGHEVALLTCEDDDVPNEGWNKFRIDHHDQIASLTLQPGVPTCVRVPLADFTRRNALASERDTPTQYLPRMSLQVARHLLEPAIGGRGVLHLHGIWPPSNDQLARLAKRMGVPFVVSPHGMLDAWSMAQGGFKKRLFLRLVSGWQLRQARLVHFENEEERTQGRAYVTAPTCAGPPPPLDPRAFEPLPGPAIARSRWPELADATRPKVLFLGRLTPKKGPERLLEAAAIWRQRGTRALTLFAGLGHPPEYEQVLRTRAKELGVDEDVRFLGLVTGAEKWSLLQAADVMALPTSQENFGIALVEGMLCGLPVVTTKQVDTWREFEAGGGAVVVEGGERVAEQVAGAVEALWNDRAGLRAMGERGRSWAQGVYEPGAMARAYEGMVVG